MFEKGSETVPKVARSLFLTGTEEWRVGGNVLTRRKGFAEHLDAAMEANDKMCDVDKAAKFDDHGPFHRVTGGVGFVRIVRLYRECSDMPLPGSEWLRELRP